MNKKLCILGSTGSIGTQTLQVVDNNRDVLSVEAMTAGDNIALFTEQILRYRPRVVAVKSEDGAETLKKKLQGHSEAKELPLPEILYGMDGFVACASLPETYMVVAAMVVMIGLQPVMEAIRKGKDIALANKETLVTAGHLIMPLAREYGVSLLPVDSEHSAIFQCLQSGSCEEIEEIFLTASGGPFRHSTEEELERVTVEQALAHPNWSMGKKITIDSATMINKGLEIIEACWLFHVGLEQVHVLVQPKSIIHSMVGFRDGAVMAQLGTPDMRLPIQYALYYPKRMPLSGQRLDFYKLGCLTFEQPDLETFDGLKLAYEAARRGGNLPAVFNAANERAVAKFLSRSISFLEITQIIHECMLHCAYIEQPDLTQILETEHVVYEWIESRW